MTYNSYYSFLQKCGYNSSPNFKNLVDNAELCVYENSKFVIDLEAYDRDGNSYEFGICGGADANFFTVDPVTGVLSFKTGMDYERPLSANGDNIYDVTVKVRDCYGAYSLKTLKVEVCDVDETPASPECIVLEAEDFYSCGFTTVCSTTASGGEIVKLSSDRGAIATRFQGDDGDYKLSLFAQDENDGVSKLLVYVDGKLIDIVYLDQQNDGCGSNNGSFSEFNLGQISIETGDVIYIEAYKNCNEYVRIDKICLEPVGEADCYEDVVIAAEDFESGVQGWNTCKTSYDSDFSTFLGRFGKCEYPSKTYDIPADAESVSVAFDLYVIDSWDGEHMYVKVDNTIVDLGGFCAGQEVGSVSGSSNGIDFTLETTAGPAHMGFSGCYDWNKDQIVRVVLSVPADKIEGNEMTLTFGASLDQSVYDESFGLDNILITAKVPCDDEPVLGSIGDTVFFDANGNGTFDATEAGIAGVAVQLLDADGNVLETQATDANGNYLFDELEAGDYRVQFGLVDGLVFTTEGSAADDVVDGDSDADESGRTNLISLGEGVNLTSIDAGLVVANNDPVAEDDLENDATCASEAIIVDVLANDEDSDGDTISVSAIGGNSAIGATILLSGTAAITYADESTGSLQYTGLKATLTESGIEFDGNDAFLSLNVGDTAEIIVSYAIEDGQGGSDTADIALTFCGTAESVEDIDASLPTTVSYQIADSLWPVFDENNIGDFVYDIMISATGDERLDGVVFTSAYCMSFSDPADTAGTIETAPVLTGALYTSETAPADLFDADEIGVNGAAAADNLDLITYILNQDYSDSGRDIGQWEIQWAIWSLTDDTDYALYVNAYDAFGETDDIDYIIADAIANGEGYTAGSGDLVALIIDPEPETETNGQPFVITAAFDDLDCLC